MTEPAPLRILLVEDDEFDVAVFSRAFRQGDVACEIVRCRTGEEALDGLRGAELALDVLVTDHQLPGRSGFELCLELIERYRQPAAGGTGPPFALVLLTGVGSEQMAIRALRAGINDYIVKDSSREYLDLLPLVLPRVARRHRRRHRQRLAEQQPEGASWTASAGGGGLSAAAETVRQRGGRVWVEDAGSASATLCFKVALAPEEVAFWTGEESDVEPVQAGGNGAIVGEKAARAPDGGESASEGPRYALIVHPNPIVTFVARRAVERAGWRCAVIDSGAAAIEALEREPFDLVLLAPEMPGLDGVETARRIRGHRQGAISRVPIIALGTGEADGERCRQAGIDRAVDAPVTASRLQAALG